jgi:glucose-1-phosphate thymidylyltransferase
MKGIILAGGRGSRLYPITSGVSKQLLPIYDKPMIYYPLSILMLAGIREVLIITTPEDSYAFKKVLGDGTKWGMKFNYAIQDEPKGLADAFIVGRDFCENQSVALVLGDNILYGGQLSGSLKKASQIKKGALVFGYPVRDPERYGVIEIDENGKAISIEEKPEKPRSNFAIPGIYFYDKTVVEKALSLKPSKRGELEITDLNRLYLSEQSLKISMLGRGVAWLDAGTFDSLLQAVNFVQAIEERQGLLIASPEEIAYYEGFITKEQLTQLVKALPDNSYKKYLYQLVKTEKKR